jgi:hypothetical protein
MSEGTAVSVIWLLVLLLAASILTGLWLVRSLTDIVLALHAQNKHLVQWREQFSRTFQYVEDDADVGDIWGDEQEERH